MGQTLKVLNAARYYEIGIPITYQQSVWSPIISSSRILTQSPFRYTHTSPQHLLDRLTSRNLHLVAFRMCSFLQMQPDSILKHWAIAKIAKSKGSNAVAAAAGGTDEDAIVCKLIVDKFRGASGSGAGSAVSSVSFAEVAKKAWENGRSRLATMVRIPIDSPISALKQILRSS